MFDIDEVTKNNNTVRRMWALEPVEDIKLNNVKYGTVPKGYREIFPAASLEIGKIYRVHGMYFLRFIDRKGKIISEVYSHSEFHEKLVRPLEAMD